MDWYAQRVRQTFWMNRPSIPHFAIPISAFHPFRSFPPITDHFSLTTFRCVALTAEENASLRSQFAILKTGRGRHRKYRPYAFTEYGALMAANILNSPRAVQMSIFVVRAFAKMREALLASPDLARKLAALEKKLTGRLDVHEAAIVKVLQDLMQILNPPPLPPDPPQRKIGFQPPA
jgi:hypothetical protein